MIRFKYFIIIGGLIFFSCANKGLQKDTKKESKKNNTSQIQSDPFYPLQKSITDMQNQIFDLKSKVVEYESKLHSPSISTELLKLVQRPNLKHEIIMNNGTVIQGTIIFENTDQMIVKTQIGQLTIEKEFVTTIKEAEPLQPVVEFNINKEIEERINDNQSISYVGEVINTGARRADFVRIVYHFWADDTSPMYSDSCFVSGKNKVYLNGVISDASIEPSETATFHLNINLPDSLKFEYITKDIQWDIFD